MGLFGRKDWSVIAVMHETKGRYRVNGNRKKGSEAVKIRDGAKKHDRTVFWAVFDQKGAYLEGAPGPGRNLVPSDVLERLKRELPRMKTVREILAALESGKTDRVAKELTWDEG